MTARTERVVLKIDVRPFTEALQRAADSLSRLDWLTLRSAVAGGRSVSPHHRREHPTRASDAPSQRSTSGPTAASVRRLARRSTPTTQTTEEPSMTDRTTIEWTDSTWNPVTGCSKVSPGCDHCYAETLAERFRGTPGHYFEHGFDVQPRPDKLDQPLRWQRPRRIFVNSMSDLFHDAIASDYIAQVFAVMACAPQHTFQVLTKRHGRMRSLLSSSEFQAQVYRAINALPTDARADVAGTLPLPNVWVGVSVENQQWADIRIPALLETPAAVRFLSMEPLLGPVDLSQWIDLEVDCGQGDDGCPRPALSWVIVGGESGRGARPMHQEWARSLRDQCAAAGVPFLFKQWGEWAPQKTVAVGMVERDERLGEIVDDRKYPDFTWRRVYRRVGKKAAGRELDGRTWDEFPKEER